MLANPTDSIFQYTLQLKSNTDQIDFNDRISLLYFVTDSIGDKNDYVVKIQGYCSRDNKLKKASAFAQERADAVKATLIDNGFFDYQIIYCDGKGGPDINEDKVWLTFFPRTMKKEQIAAYEQELARQARYVYVKDSLQAGDLQPGKIDPNRRVNAIVSFPSLISYFDAFFFQGMRSAEEILRDEKILIRPTNKATIISSKRIYLK